MYVRTYVCIYVCIHTYIHTYILVIYTHLCMLVAASRSLLRKAVLAPDVAVWTRAGTAQRGLENGAPKTTYNHRGVDRILYGVYEEVPIFTYIYIYVYVYMYAYWVFFEDHVTSTPGWL